MSSPTEPAECSEASESSHVQAAPPGDSPEEPVPAESASIGKAIVGALMGRQLDYTRGPLGRAIVLLAIPMVLEMAMESTFAICDIWFVSELGSAAVAAVGITESLVMLVYALAIGVSMGVTAFVARRVGEGNVPGAVLVARQAIVVGLAAGAAIGIPGAIFGGELLALMGAEDSVIEAGSGYTSIVLGSNVVIFLLFLNNAIFRGAGDAAIAMRALWIANGINILLDPCFIFGLGPFPELGVTGAAVATTIGRGTGVAYQFWALRNGSSRIVIGAPFLRISTATIRELLRLSKGGVLQFIIAMASWIVLMRIMAEFGEAAVAGYTIAVRVIIFTILPGWGLSNAAATLVGQSLGAKNPERAERAVWLSGLYNAGFFLAVMAVFLVFGERIIGIFAKDDADVVKHGADALRIIAYGYVFYAWGMVITQAFNGAGDTMTPTKINFFCFWLLQIPLAWALASAGDFGPSGVYWAIAIAESILAVISLVLFRRGRWKSTVIADTSEDEVPAALGAAGEV